MTRKDEVVPAQLATLASAIIRCWRYTQNGSVSNGKARRRSRNQLRASAPSLASTVEFAGWTLRDIEVGYNHDSNGVPIQRHVVGTACIT